LIALADGRLEKSQALSETIAATRQFAKRQMTWFRNRMSDYVRVKPNESNIISLLTDNFA
jgi:tRNA dimethylallyltransferase